MIVPLLENLPTGDPRSLLHPPNCLTARDGLVFVKIHANGLTAPWEGHGLKVGLSEAAGSPSGQECCSNWAGMLQQRGRAHIQALPAWGCRREWPHEAG